MPTGEVAGQSSPLSSSQDYKKESGLQKGVSTLIWVSYSPATQQVDVPVPRNPRFFLPDLPVHVVQRGNNRLTVVVDDDDRRLYLD